MLSTRFGARFVIPDTKLGDDQRAKIKKEIKEAAENTGKGYTITAGADLSAEPYIAGMVIETGKDQYEPIGRDYKRKGQSGTIRSITKTEVDRIERQSHKFNQQIIGILQRNGVTDYRQT